LICLLLFPPSIYRVGDSEKVYMPIYKKGRGEKPSVETGVVAERL
jgi:hypothetical protein